LVHESEEVAPSDSGLADVQRPLLDSKLTAKQMVHEPVPKKSDRVKRFSRSVGISAARLHTITTPIERKKVPKGMPLMIRGRVVAIRHEVQSGCGA
jgi:hypothetical protein